MELQQMYEKFNIKHKRVSNLSITRTTSHVTTVIG